MIGPKTLVKMILTHIGEDPNRPGLKDTPERVVAMWTEVFRGYKEDKLPRVTKFRNGSDGVVYDEMLIDKGYFFSHCEHHMVPFFGEYSFGYIPDKWIIGASKISRIVDHFSSRLQIAERLVCEIADYIQDAINPKGLILLMSARHLCKEMRGVKKYNSPFETIAVRGIFLTNKRNCKDEFLSRVK